MFAKVDYRIHLQTPLTSVSVLANSVDPDQTAPTEVWSRSTLFVYKASKTSRQMKKQTTFVIGALRVKVQFCKCWLR